MPASSSLFYFIFIDGAVGHALEGEKGGGGKRKKRDYLWVQSRAKGEEEEFFKQHIRHSSSSSFGFRTSARASWRQQKK